MKGDRLYLPSPFFFRINVVPYVPLCGAYHSDSHQQCDRYPCLFYTIIHFADFEIETFYEQLHYDVHHLKVDLLPSFFFLFYSRIIQPEIHCFDNQTYSVPVETYLKKLLTASKVTDVV